MLNENWVQISLFRELIRNVSLQFPEVIVLHKSRDIKYLVQ